MKPRQTYNTDNQLIECIRPILPSIRNTPYGKRIQSKLAREDSSFGYGGGYEGGGGRGGRGGFREDRGRGGGYHRHLGRPQLQHVNALTEVYGSQGGPYMGGPPQYGMPQGHHPHPSQGHGHGGHGHGGHGHMAPTHTGMSYHAPGPDGQPWLHLRGPGGQPAPNWPVHEGANIGQLPSSNEGTPAPSVHGDHPGMDNGVMWDQQFMPFNNGQLPPPNGHHHSQYQMM